MIILKHDLVVDTDGYDYTLMLDKHKVDKKGEPVYDTLSYHGSLTGAVRSARDYCVKKRLNEEVFTLSEAVEEMASITDEFMALLKERSRDE